MMAKKKPTASVPVDAHKHVADTRPNIPTRETAAFARTRLMAARFPYYLLADSVEGRKKQSDLSGTFPDLTAPQPHRDMHKGFVYRTVPHVTLKSIANNPDIREGMTRAEIDKAIARHADSETLYDQPYEDKNIVRLTGPFTVEFKLGKLNVLPVRMNPELAMGDELLKKTGAGNLFTVFGEPDVKLTTQDGKVIVEIRGVDVFDPSTGAVRTGDTDDIACWFIDTDYDGQSFFVRHAYFLYGGKDTKEGPYDKLKKALRAEIDEGEWSKLYRATSQPFAPPKSGRIAVKVINHFGDEVLKVYPITTAPKSR